MTSFRFWSFPVLRKTCQYSHVTHNLRQFALFAAVCCRIPGNRETRVSAATRLKRLRLGRIATAARSESRLVNNAALIGNNCSFGEAAPHFGVVSSSGSTCGHVEEQEGAESSGLHRQGHHEELRGESLCQAVGDPLVTLALAVILWHVMFCP